MKKIRREETLGRTLQDDVTSLTDSLADIGSQFFFVFICFSWVSTRFCEVVGDTLLLRQNLLC